MSAQPQGNSWEPRAPLPGVWVVCASWILVVLSCGTPPALARGAWLVQQQAPSQAVRAQLFAIEGHGQTFVYVLRDSMGRFHRLRVDAQTKRDRPLVPGEWVDVQIAPDGRALSILPAK